MVDTVFKKLYSQAKQAVYKNRKIWHKNKKMLNTRLRMELVLDKGRICRYLIFNRFHLYILRI